MTLSNGHYGGLNPPKLMDSREICARVSRNWRTALTRPFSNVSYASYCVTVMVSGLDVFHNPSASATVIS